MHQTPPPPAISRPDVGRRRQGVAMPWCRRWRRGLAGLAAGLGLLSLTACSDGYPSEDVVPIDPSSMTQAELLTALNDLGREPHLGRRWRYALHENCELEVSVRGAERARVPLDGAEVSTRAVDTVSEIRLVPKNGDEAQALTVLETRRWSDTVRARSLLTYLEMRCLGSSDDAAGLLPSGRPTQALAFLPDAPAMPRPHP